MTHRRHITRLRFLNLIPADIANAATVPITVTNPATSGTGAYGSGGALAETSAPMIFTVN